MNEKLFKALMEAHDKALKEVKEEPNLYEQYKLLGRAEGLIEAIEILKEKGE